MGKTLTAGGLNVLDPTSERKVDPDVAEKNEPRNKRRTDALGDILTSTLGDIGLSYTSYQFDIHKPGLRSTEIVFDRYWPKVQLVTQNFARRQNADQNFDPELEQSMSEHQSFADANGLHFLPIINGEIDRDQLLRLKERIVK